MILSIRYVLVCNKCFSEFLLPQRRGVPYEAKCPRCGLAKTDRRLSLLSKNSTVHRIIVVPKPSRNYVLYEMWKQTWKQTTQNEAGRARATVYSIEKICVKCGRFFRCLKANDADRQGLCSICAREMSNREDPRSKSDRNLP